MPYTYVEFLNHVEQIEKEGREWIKATRPNSTESELNAYVAGIKSGALKAYSLLKLHAGVNLSTESKK